MPSRCETEIPRTRGGCDCDAGQGHSKPGEDAVDCSNGCYSRQRMSIPITVLSRGRASAGAARQSPRDTPASPKRISAVGSAIGRHPVRRAPVATARIDRRRTTSPWRCHTHRGTAPPLVRGAPLRSRRAVERLWSILESERARLGGTAPQLSRWCEAWPSCDAPGFPPRVPPARPLSTKRAELGDPPIPAGQRVDERTDRNDDIPLTPLEIRSDRDLWSIRTRFVVNPIAVCGESHRDP